jgi:GIY-YIG catalytic domain
MAINITLPDANRTLAIDTVHSLMDSLSRGAIYVFFDNKRPLYVGKTNNFYRRFTEHRKYSTFFSSAIDVTVYFEEDARNRDIYETFAIDHFRPLYNSGKTYHKLNHDGSLQNEIEDLDYRIASISEEIAEIEGELRQLKAIDSEEDGDFTDLYDDYYDQKSTFALGDVLLKQRQLNDLGDEMKRLTKLKTKLTSKLAN